MTQKLIEVLKKCSECFNIKSLSKTISGMPNRKQAFFMSVKLVNPTISHYSQGNTIISHIYVRHDGLTPQNKPHGEYVGRLLIVPRVKPITIFLNGYFLKTLNLLGAYQMLKSYFINIISFIVFIVGMVLFNFAVLFSMALVLSLGA